MRVRSWRKGSNGAIIMVLHRSDQCDMALGDSDGGRREWAAHQTVLLLSLSFVAWHVSAMVVDSTEAYYCWCHDDVLMFDDAYTIPTNGFDAHDSIQAAFVCLARVCLDEFR